MVYYASNQASFIKYKNLGDIILHRNFCIVFTAIFAFVKQFFLHQNFCFFTPIFLHQHLNFR